MSIRFPHLGLELDYVGKSLHIFGFEITIYGILIAVGMLLGIAFVVLEAKRRNQNQDMYLDMVIISLVAAVIGARLYYVGFSWSLYKGNILEIFNTRSGGMGLYGGILGGVLAAALFCHIKRLPFWQMADTASMGILIGQIIGRWGNFFNRESFGEYTDSFFAMQLPLSAVRASEVTTQMRENLVTIDGISYIQVHPVFLYESLWCLLLFLLLLIWRRRKRFQGELFMRYLAGYGFARFFIEGLRTDQLLFPGTKLAVSQIVSALLFIFFGFTVAVRRTMVKKRAELRKRRREEAYEAEEKAAQELDYDQEEGGLKSEWGDRTEVAQEDSPVSSAEAGSKPPWEGDLESARGVRAEAAPETEVESGPEIKAEPASDEWNLDAAHTHDAWRAARLENAAKSGADEEVEEEWYMRPRQRWGRVEDIPSREDTEDVSGPENPQDAQEAGEPHRNQGGFIEESDSEPKA